MSTMSMDTTPVESPRVDPEVTAYVGLVRAALRDLAPEDLDDLTGGLEADLAELAAESEEPLLARVGEPSAYAAELRAAAGLPPAPSGGATVATARPSLAQRTARVGDWWRGVISERPWIAEVRPLWWALRGVVAWGMVAGVMGMRSLVVGIVLVAGSVWLGLRTPEAPQGVRRLVRIGNVLAVLLALPALAALGWLSGGAGYAESGGVSYELPEGVTVGGEQVSSFYVYDGAGNRVDGARIFTDAGTLVTIDPWMVPSMDGTYEDESPIDTFPVDSGGLEGWSGNTLEPGGWTPPVLIGPAPGMTAATEPAAPTSVPTPSAGPDEPAVEPSSEPSEATATP